MTKKQAEKDTYKKDYEDIETSLIYDNVPYSKAKKTLLEIIAMNVFKF